MAESTTVQGAAEKISGLLNPNQDNQVPEKKAEPSEQPQEEVKKRNLHKRVNHRLVKLQKKKHLKILRSKKKRKQHLRNQNSTELKYKVKS